MENKCQLDGLIGNDLGGWLIIIQLSYLILAYDVRFVGGRDYCT